MKQHPTQARIQTSFIKYNFIRMNKFYFFLILPLVACSTGYAQTKNADTSQATAKPYLSERYVEGLLEADQQRFVLTPDQSAKAKVVLTAYAAKFNEMAKNVTSVTDYKASIRSLDLERIYQYKTFLNAGQYSKMIATYNKLHPKNPIVP